MATVCTACLCDVAERVFQGYIICTKEVSCQA